MKSAKYTICEKEKGVWKPAAYTDNLSKARRICTALQHAYPGCVCAILAGDKPLEIYSGDFQVSDGLRDPEGR